MNPGTKNKDGVMIIGDVHAMWHILNKLIETKKPSIILACGDFGVWPGHQSYEMSKIIPGECKIYFCDGNHENHDYLNHFINEVNGGKRDKPLEMLKNIFFCPRGSTLELPDGRTVLFMGGGYSIDKHHRTPGYDWFPDETLKPRDLQFLPDKKIDILISHTCAKSNLKDMLGANSLKCMDISNDVLESVIEKYQPKFWAFGHWHHYKKGNIGSSHWVALNMSGCDGFWIWLK